MIENKKFLLLSSVIVLALVTYYASGVYLDFPKTTIIITGILFAIINSTYEFLIVVFWALILANMKKMLIRENRRDS